MLEGDVFFFFNDTATTEIYTLSLHDALPISCARDEIEPLRDPRVKENDAYATVIVLSRVVTELGTVGRVTPKTIEGLFVSDFSYLQDLYRIINFQDPSILDALEPGTPFPLTSAEVG